MSAQHVTGGKTPVTPDKRLVLASDNRGKLLELRALMAPLAVPVDAQGALGIAAAEEPYDTFLENALTKARHAAHASGRPALADDSGLCCRALGGGPGVRSARFADGLAGDSGDAHARDAANNALLLQRLAGRADRRAHYCCVVVALRHADDPEPLFAEGRWEGEIVDTPQGEGGFGYDPYFWLPQIGCTAAQLESARKNQLSHRAQAMRAILPLLRERWDW
jgi:XTP/dITP diphosphohydrolase